MPITEHCAGCPYRVFGPAIGTRGDPSRPIVLVGEAPGANEIVEQEPFVGRAGERLWMALSEAGLNEQDVFVVNAVACRPYHPKRPKVRKPSPEAIVACHGRLAREIAAFPRAGIAALGVTAIQAVTWQEGQPWTREPSRAPQGWGPVVPTLHPAFVLRRRLGGPEYMTLVADLARVRDVAGM